MTVSWSPSASRLVEEAFAFIAADRPSAARDWLDRLLREVSTLADHPLRGRAVPEFSRSDLRELVVTPYRVVYTVDDEVVHIVGVIHGRRSLRDALAED